MTTPIPPTPPRCMRLWSLPTTQLTPPHRHPHRGRAHPGGTIRTAPHPRPRGALPPHPRSASPRSPPPCTPGCTSPPRHPRLARTPTPTLPKRPLVTTGLDLDYPPPSPPNSAWRRSNSSHPAPDRRRRPHAAAECSHWLDALPRAPRGRARDNRRHLRNPEGGPEHQNPGTGTISSHNDAETHTQVYRSVVC
jgi:hypothetical protein